MTIGPISEVTNEPGSQEVMKAKRKVILDRRCLLSLACQQPHKQQLSFRRLWRLGRLTMITRYLPELVERAPVSA
jgi:hypothetical protein